MYEDSEKLVEALETLIESIVEERIEDAIREHESDNPHFHPENII